MNSDTSLMVNLVGNLGALGFIFWLVWRTFNHTIPRLAESFEKGISEQRQDHRAELDRARAEYLQALATQRKEFTDQLERERAFHSEHGAALSAAIKELALELRHE